MTAPAIPTTIARPHPIRRLVSFGTVVVDVISFVPALPEPGGDVLASRSTLETGGGLIAMAAARRGGLATVHMGVTGTGPFGDIARVALADAGITTVLAPVPAVDTGLCLVLVDPTGERTFVTLPGAEGLLEPAALGEVPIRRTDAVLVSGYGLVQPVTRRAVMAAVAGLPATATLIVDPGPLGHALDEADLAALFGRADWWVCNSREANLLTGEPDPATAATALAERLVEAGAHRGEPGRPGHAVVRVGAAGCILARSGRPPVVVSAVPVAVASTNGAGDAHTGALAAALAAGRPPVPALRQANEAAGVFLGSRS